MFLSPFEQHPLLGNVVERLSKSGEVGNELSIEIVESNKESDSFDILWWFLILL